MPTFVKERRRAPRVQVPEDSEGTASLNLSVPVQILDLSGAGVLLASKSELCVGDRAELRGQVGAKPINVAIDVKHVSIDMKARGGPRYKAGAVFEPESPEHSVALEQLLASEPK